MYLPSVCLFKKSIMHLTIPQALSIFKAICDANSNGLNCCIPRITCLSVARTLTRETNLKIIIII